MKLLCIFLFYFVFEVENFCFHASGGVGEYHWPCPDSIEMEACYARCNCWTDFPDMGGQITHEVDAWCFQDSCWCSYDQVIVNCSEHIAKIYFQGWMSLWNTENKPILL